MQVKNFALARQEVVLNVEAIHGFEMALQDGNRNQVGNLPLFRCSLPRSRAASRRAPAGSTCLLHTNARRAHRDPSIVIEAGRGGERFDLRARLLLDVQESNHHVGDLHSGVVDVVLDVHFPARKAQQADERVAEDGVAQVADMRGLVGIDAGMLDQDFAGGSVRGGDSSAASAVASSARFTRTLMYPPPATSNFSKPGIAPTPETISSAILRGALRSFLREFESDGQRVLAKFDFRRLLDHNVGDFQAVSAAQKLAQMLDQSAFQMSVQGSPLN